MVDVEMTEDYGAEARWASMSEEAQKKFISDLSTRVTSGMELEQLLRAKNLRFTRKESSNKSKFKINNRERKAIIADYIQNHTV